ncbi:MAG TPA: prepilin-type N-terminal cleavage/methylation domain-containing protein [Candidatus Omnitrophota bacterium]|nr:prepilin-type N-terminal cleavage/methylation domain-containing protein [Candidatus Omnitrophota bacterium]HPS37503.1 prepilin-type N-terminal cleavage/methylation domain-containing protein [Candidatus Omnitrophota bacterium]
MKRSKGFTLIEVLIVVVIIAVLAALLIPRMMAQTKKAKAAEAFVIMGVIKRAAQRQHDLTGSFPLVGPEYIQSCVDPAQGGSFGDWGPLGLRTPLPSQNWCTMYDAGTHAGGEEYGDVRVWDVGNWDDFIYCHMHSSGEITWACGGRFKNSGDGAEAADPCTLG